MPKASGRRAGFDTGRSCNYRFGMSRTIRIRNVPDTLHRRLLNQAAQAGIPLPAWLLQRIREMAERLTSDGLRARLACRSAVTPSVDTADAVRAERSSR